MRHAQFILAIAALLATIFCASAEAAPRIHILTWSELMSLNPLPLPTKERVVIQQLR